MALFFFNRHSHLQRSCNSSPGILADIQLSSPDIFFMKNRKMQIVRIAAENFLYRIVKIMPDDDFDLLEFGDALLREASVGGMPVSGALQLHYRFNRPVGQADEVHLALPVRAFAEDYDGLFHLKRTESFCCITDVVHCNIGAFTERWRKLERCASMLRLERGESYREILASTEEQNSGFRILQLEVRDSTQQRSTSAHFKEG